MDVWQRRFVWLPVYVEDGFPARFGWRWLVPVWHRWFESKYGGHYWRPATHRWD